MLNFNGTTSTSFSSHQWQGSEFLKIFFTDSSEAYDCRVLFGNQWSVYPGTRTGLQTIENYGYNTIGAYPYSIGDLQLVI